MKKVVVVGGGAAGMFAAITAADHGAQVTLIEKNEKLGKKLFITGKGRCNVTNAAPMEDVMNSVITNPRFLYSAFDMYTNADIMKFLEESGCKLKVERGDRVFPVSDHSSDVISAFQRAIADRGISVRLNTLVTGIVTETLAIEDEVQPVEGSVNDKYSKKKKASKKVGPERKVIGVNTDTKGVISADVVIICTGGVSYPLTGSTGDGIRFAKEMGIETINCVPSLVPFETEEVWCRELMGLTLKNVKATLYGGDKELYSEQGELLMTHFGVSGPLVLTASCYYAGFHSKKPEAPCRLVIDLKPALDLEQLDKRLVRDFEDNNNKQFKNALNGLFPTKMIPIMIEYSGIEADKYVNKISREERRHFAEIIKALPLHITGTRPFAEAIITSGGIKVSEINPSTMDSRRVQGLKFAGEVIDVDAVTGGFNLQIAWSTGYVAGSTI